VSTEYHKHVLDGEEKYFPADTCPICNPQQTQPARRQREPAQVYTKGETVVIKVSKAQLMTIHWWKDGNAFLYSHKRMARNTAGERMLDREGMPIWEQVTFRLNVPLTKVLIHELSGLLQVAEGVEGVPTRQ